MLLIFFFLFPHAVFTALHMSLTAKELLVNRHEIHSVSTQLGTSVIRHLLLTLSCLFFMDLKTVSKNCRRKLMGSLSVSGS